MWWCTVLDGAKVNLDGESTSKGNFWLVCDHQILLRSENGRKMQTLGVRSSEIHPSRNRASIGSLQAVAFRAIFGEDSTAADTMTLRSHSGTQGRCRRACVA
jgi:hypothetical protein